MHLNHIQFLLTGNLPHLPLFETRYLNIKETLNTLLCHIILENDKRYTN